MRILIDLQVCQSEDRLSARARYSLSLCKAMAWNQNGEEVWVLLNNECPESARDICLELDGLVPRERVLVFNPPVGTVKGSAKRSWRKQVAEKVRDCVIVGIHPDIVHVAGVSGDLEGAAAPTVSSLEPRIGSTVSFYDSSVSVAPASGRSSRHARDCGLYELGSLENTDLVLAVTGYAQEQAVGRLGLDPQAVANISFGHDARYRRVEVAPSTVPELADRIGIGESFIFCDADGLESEDALSKVVEGYVAIPKTLRERHPLLIAGGISESASRRIMTRARAGGMNGREIVVTDRVTESDRPAMYNLCALFVLGGRPMDLPLSVVDAMACGAPVLGPSCTSVPEVIGLEDAVFNPTDSRSVTSALTNALGDKDFCRRLVEHGLQRSKDFSWDACARRALDAFTEVCEQRADRRCGGFLSTPGRPRLALVSPADGKVVQAVELCPGLLEGLSDYYDVELISNPGAVYESPSSERLPVRSFDWFEDNRCRYTRLLYCVGSGDSYVPVLGLLERYPGAVILYDFFLGGLVEASGRSTDPSDGLTRELYRSHGYAALKTLFDEGADYVKGRFPCNRLLVERAVGVILHSLPDVEAAREWYGESVDEYFSHVSLEQDWDNPDPEQIGRAYRDVLERFYSSHPLARQLQLAESIAAVESPRRLTENDLKATARSIATSGRPLRLRQLFVDVSSVATHDNRTGVQRVTRAVLHELLASPPEGFRVEPVYGICGRYYYARRFSLQVLQGDKGSSISDAPIDAHQCDLLVGLDLAVNLLEQGRRELIRLHNKGVCLTWVVYDLLPILRPDWFENTLEDEFRRWFEIATELGDGLVAISRSVQTEIDAWLDERGRRGANRPRTAFFHLGSDIQKSAPTKGIPASAEMFLDDLRSTPTLLMVGTLEPRKGHAQVVAAFDELWRQGQEVNLLIVGKEGWLVDALADRLRKHPQRDRRLHWLEDVSDEYLEMIYPASMGLIAASYGEGFGLPLIEAAQHGLPIIARDIPVFREVAGEHAYYFDTVSPEGLAESIKVWLGLRSKGMAPSSHKVESLTWQQSTEDLVAAVLEISAGSGPNG